LHYEKWDLTKFNHQWQDGGNYAILFKFYLMAQKKGLFKKNLSSLINSKRFR